MSRRNRNLAVLAGVAIALLAAALLLEVGRARDEGRRGVCRHCLKAVRLACGMYASDHDGEWPFSERGSLASLSLLFDQYMSCRKNYVCPSMPDDACTLTAGVVFRSHQCSFDYLPGLTGIPLGAGAPDGLLVAHEKTPVHRPGGLFGNYGRNVLFSHGLVEFVEEGEFRRRLEKDKKRYEEYHRAHAPELRRVPKGRLRCEVVDADGNPRAQMRLHVQCPTQTLGVQTDDEGTLGSGVLVPAGPAVVCTRSNPAIVCRADVADGGSADVRLVRSRGGSRLDGRVTLRGELLHGVNVDLFSSRIEQQGGHWFRAHTNASGVYAITGIPAGEYVLYAGGARPGGEQGWHSQFRFLTLAIRANENRRISIALPTATVAGMVIDGGGRKPAGNTKVILRLRPENVPAPEIIRNLRPERYAVTDADGKFSCEGAQDGTWQAIVVSAGQPRGEPVAVVVQGGIGVQNLALRLGRLVPKLKR